MPSLLLLCVGDFHQTLITNAETGQPFETLKAHKDDAFACAWADDGIHVASAAQDSTIAVWDARYWRKPLAVLPAEQSIPRILRFSPVGSGPRVLVAAEADDYINIINAQTFESKQVFDLFGPTAGISMTPDGQSLFVANAERRFGGIVELERTGWGETFGPKYDQDMFADKLFQFEQPTRELSRLCVREGFQQPIARLEKETGRYSRHAVFIVGVYSGEEKLGEGQGSSLPEAKIKAAISALKGWYLYSPVSGVDLPFFRPILPTMLGKL